MVKKLKPYLKIRLVNIRITIMHDIKVVRLQKSGNLIAMMFLQLFFLKHRSNILKNLKDLAKILALVLQSLKKKSMQLVFA